MALTLSNWWGHINRTIVENTDYRTKDWPLIGNPSMLVVTVIAYLYFVCVYGPNYMKDKKPFGLKKTITIYNLGQILACVYLFHGILTAGWLDEYSLGCQPVDTSQNPKAFRMAQLVWWTMILKLTEFLETIFFVLRKKEKQISGLHLYHHVSTLWIGWIGCRFAPGGMTTFPIMINCLVHIIMYTYYLIALHGGKELQKKLLHWKKAITVIQMVQFTIIIIHSLTALKSDCKIPGFIPYIFTSNVFLLYYMFYKFYKSTYNKNR